MDGTTARASTRNGREVTAAVSTTPSKSRWPTSTEVSPALTGGATARVCPRPRIWRTGAYSPDAASGWTTTVLPPRPLRAWMNTSGAPQLRSWPPRSTVVRVNGNGTPPRLGTNGWPSSGGASMSGVTSGLRVTCPNGLSRSLAG